MFTDTQLCPCIFTANWVSHEETCGASMHQCLTCKYCWANIAYWERVDKILEQPETAATSQDNNDRTTMPKTSGTESGKKIATKGQVGRPGMEAQVKEGS